MNGYDSLAPRGTAAYSVDALLMSECLPTPFFPPSPPQTRLNVAVSPHAPSPSPSSSLLSSSTLYDDVASQARPTAMPRGKPPRATSTRHRKNSKTQTKTQTQRKTKTQVNEPLSGDEELGDREEDGAAVFQRVVTLDEVERDILRTHAHLPVEATRKMVKAEFKRLKHCETVRQSRVRKKHERSGLKQVSAALEQTLEQSLVAVTARPDWGHFDESSWWDVTFKKFVRSIYEVRALRHERGELKDRLMLFDTVGEQLERLQTDFQIPQLPRGGANDGCIPSVGTIHIEPLSVEQARAIMLDSHEQALSFFRSMTWPSARSQGQHQGQGSSHPASVHPHQSLPLPPPPPGASSGQLSPTATATTEPDQEKTNGWTQHQRVTANGGVQFNFTKRITSISAEALVEKSWEMYCDLDLYRGIYASVQRLEILQRINEDTLLIRRDLQEGASAPIFRTVFLLFRIRLENGYVICFRSHNPTVFADDGADDDPNVQWMDMFYWLMVLDPPPAAPGQPAPLGCDVSFGGNLLTARSAHHATVWKYQIAMALLRWESNAVAPLFALLG